MPAERRVVQRRQDQRRRFALRGQCAQLAVGKEADLAGARSVERRDRRDRESGSPTRLAAESAHQVAEPNAQWVACADYLSSAFSILSVMSMRGLT